MTARNRRGFLRTAALGTIASAVGFPHASALGASLFNGDTVFKQEWDRVIADAQAEGALSLITWGETWGGAGFPAVIKRFEQEFPGITVELYAESSADVWLSKVRKERRSGVYAYDLAIVQPDAALQEGKPEGMWAPIRPLLVRPDVVDDSAWLTGFNSRFLDVDGELCFAWEYQVIHVFSTNTDLVARGKIGTVKDLLDPQWSEKIIATDPRIGLGLIAAASVARARGSDVLKQLLVDQRPTLSTNSQELASAVVEGSYPVALGVRPKALDDYQGLADKVAFLDLPDADYAVTTPILYFDRAPHPAAAKLFANWILTQNGQRLLTRSLPTNSARTDVEPFEPDGIGTANGTYYEPDREDNFSHTAETQTFVREVIAT